MNKGHWNPVDAVGNVENLDFENILVPFDIGNVNVRCEEDTERTWRGTQC